MVHNPVWVVKAEEERLVFKLAILFLLKSLTLLVFDEVDDVVLGCCLYAAV